MDIPLIESDYPYSKNNLNPDFQLWILEGYEAAYKLLSRT